MRDPDLVQRAERAATALERAWIHWRTMHGLGSDPLPPVSSYVGYSLEEPWGQPRVVFGVGAEEAERLAALLDGHDCVGPIHAEVTGRPEWRHGPGSGPGLPDRAFGEQLRIPAQAPQPLADMFPPGSYAGGAAVANGIAAHDGRTAAGAPAKTTDAAAIEGEPGEGSRAEGSRAEVSRVDGALSDGALSEGALSEGAPSEGALGETPAGMEPHDETARGNADQELAPVADQFVPEDALGGADDDDVYLVRSDMESDEPVPDSSAPGSTVVGNTGRGGTEQLAPLPPLPSLEIATFRRLPEQLADGAEGAAPLAAAPIATSGYDIMPNQGPGYRGPRYQGSPPQYQSGPSLDAASSDDAATPAEDRDVAATSDRPPAGRPSTSQQARSKARQFAKRGRARRQGPGAHEAWESADERSASDHAI